MTTYRLEKAAPPRLPPLDATERAIAAAILGAVAEIRDQTVLANIRRALELNDIAGALEAIRFDMGEEYLRSIIPQQLRYAYEQTGLAVARAPAIGYSFNVLTPQAVDWVRENAGSMIQQWGDSSRDALRRIMADGFQNQIPAAALARRIKDSGIGLTWRQARAVLNMRHRMEADGIAAATIDARAKRYFQRLLRYRAEVIARTEMARASANARREAWRQAIEAGLLDTGRNEQEWLARVDARTCPECVDLDGARASVPDGQFTGDGGTDGGKGPPQHPQCRCVAMIVPIGSKKIPRARVNIPGDPGIRPRRAP